MEQRVTEINTRIRGIKKPKAQILRDTRLHARRPQLHKQQCHLMARTTSPDVYSLAADLKVES